ncbi:MAG: nucleotide exchange factor GrpE [Clostridiales bacterium]|uniref:nucleotide exchange factor GrpE n=2 Tax=Terrisporobacter sp. TaxID=1965305 RepID=UPI002A3D73B4|nr:nucleotide exchange factor GrpE [Clostridium sp.]MCI6459426.1 nucleotide exchange factor GrpE [Clostridium sp.]MCI7204916.1 nucleotide exchange factor GrpE [Clostridium sp.]MDD5878070.1 nucleotide exchange factor GrpE [Clostridiales bacterium]MDD7753526.1 nucleotide exchange factor GrpE [Clostridiales bacterium]
MENNMNQDEIKQENCASSNEEEITKDSQENVEVEEDATCDENVTDINSKLEEKKINDKIEELQKQIDEKDDKYKRLQAEYSNYMRRTQQEKETIGLFANEKIIGELIPVLDSMERAIDACTDKEDNMYKGIELVHKQLIDCLQKFGVEEIAALNEEFDPNLHLAVMQESVEGVEANKVVMVLQKGYKLKTKVIRPTMVKVSC